MSVENAKILIKQLEDDAELREAFEADPQEALAQKDYGCTFDEFKEAYNLNRELSEEELETVSAGISKGKGGCQDNYYKEECTATVEEDSWCWSNDWCSKWDSDYEYVNCYRLYH